MIAALMLAALAASATDEVVARVDGSVVTAAALNRRLQAAAAQRNYAAPRDMIDRMVNEAVFAAEARRLGMAGSPDVVARIDKQRRRAAAASFVENEIESRVEPDQKRLRQMFHATADFVAFEFLAFETKQSADGAAQRIRKGSSLKAESSGAAVSKLYPREADAPPSMRAQLEPAIAQALFAAAPGAVVGPVQGSAGWMVFRLVSKEIGTDADFAARRPALVTHARNQAGKDMVKHVVAQLWQKAGAALDEKFIREVGETPPTRAQMDHVVATVNGVPVRYADVYAAIASMPRGHGMGANVRVDAARREIDSILLQDLAVQRGHDKAPSVSAQQPDFERVALAGALVSKIEAATPPPTENEIHDFYRRNAAAFGKPFSEVLPAAAAGAAAQKRAAAVAKRLKDLRRKANVSIDQNALAEAVRARK